MSEKIQHNLAELAGKTKQITLNPEQEEASEHLHGPCFVCACPGAGKTRVITERVVRLIEKGHSPRSILCLTFTNKAGNEMKERIIKRLGKAGEEVYVSTFHSLCATIIRKYGYPIGYDMNTVILDDDDQEGLMAQCSRQAGFDKSAPQIKSLIWKANEIREDLIPENEFSSHFKEEDDASIVLDYIARMRKNKQIDFSGLLSETVRLLQTNEDVLKKLQSRFDFLQVDEAQDTNFAQFKIVQLIGAHNNVLIVGDADQGIYGWRGARYQNIEDFVNINKAKVISLPHNYRSTPQIVQIASNVIKNNPNRQQKLEFKTSNPDGQPVECYCLPTPEHEGLWIAQTIDKMIREQGYRPHDFAVLYRVNAMSRAIEQGMINVGLAYQVIGGFSFFNRAEVRDSLAALRFLINRSDGTALSRFINKPSRRIGETSLGKIENFAEEKGISLFEAMKRASEFITSGADKNRVIEGCKEVCNVFDFDRSNMSIGEVLSKLLRDLRYREYLESKHEGKDLEDRLNNIQELINSCALYSEKKGSDIASYLNSIALQTSADKKTEENVVSLLSLHASKGLEFPVVFMPCLEQGQIPHKRAIFERDGIEEERRLFYVGLTRSQKVLILSFPASRMIRYGSGKVRFDATEPSCFLKECGLMNKVKVIRAS